jgi:hypothetical protein
MASMDIDDIKKSGAGFFLLHIAFLLKTAANTSTYYSVFFHSLSSGIASSKGRDESYFYLFLGSVRTSMASWTLSHVSFWASVASSPGATNLSGWYLRVA